MNAEFFPALASVRPAWNGSLPAGDIRLASLTLSLIFLLVALRFLKRSFQPIGVLIRSVAAAAMVAMAIAAALILLGAAFLSAG